MTEWGLLDLFHSWQVYDLSEFMDRHPGGPTTILAWAGKDASKFFNEIHKGVKTLGFQTFMWSSNTCIDPCAILFMIPKVEFGNACVGTLNLDERIDAYLRPEAHLGNLGVDGDLMSDEFWHTLREAGSFPKLSVWLLARMIDVSEDEMYS